MTATVALLVLGERSRRYAGAVAPASFRATGRRSAGGRRRWLLAVALVTFVPALLARPAAGLADEPEFTAAYLGDPAHVAEGKALFKQQCARCHGRAAYPGKAPRLKPKRMDPLEIYDKMTYGFGKMPPWEEVFTDEQRMAITAYMKSRNFSN